MASYNSTVYFNKDAKEFVISLVKFQAPLMPYGADVCNV